MPLTGIAYSESFDSATLQALTPVPDGQHVRINGDNVVIPPWARAIYAAYLNGASITLGRLVAPSLRDVQTIDLEPLDRSAEPTFPLPIHEWWERPVPLEASEGLQVHAAEDGATTIARAGIWLGDGIVPIPAVPDAVMGGGRIYKARATNTTTLVAEAWTNGALTFDQDLRAGWHACVGWFARSAGLELARLVTPGVRYRPMVVGCDAVGDAGHPMFRDGRLGVQTVFYHDQPPSVDFLSLSADTSQVVDLDLIYLGEEEPAGLLEAFSARRVA